MEIRNPETQELIWGSSDKQSLALDWFERELFWGGAKGAGKTEVIVADNCLIAGVCDHLWRTTGKRVRALNVIFRVDLGQLSDIIERSHELFPTIDPDAFWNEQKKVWRFSSGLRVQMAHLEDSNAHRTWNGKEILRAYFDQIEEMPEEQYIFIRMQVRTSDARLVPYVGCRATGNPGGLYEDWVYNYFVKPAPEGHEPLVEKIRLRDGSVVDSVRVFIPAFLWDNPSEIFKATYEADLRKLPEWQQQMYLYGVWGLNPSSYFGDVFRRDVHVCEPFNIPSTWRVERTCDWGSKAPAACYWVAQDADGNHIYIDELYCPGEDGPTFGAKILALEEQHGWKNLDGYIDNQADADYGSTAPSPMQDMIAMDISWFPVGYKDKERENGWTEMHRRLKTRNPKTGVPGIIIFSVCEKLIEQIARARNDPKNKNDVDRKQENHANDSCRYYCQVNPVPQEEKKLSDDVRRWRGEVAKRQAKTQRDIHSGY